MVVDGGSLLFMRKVCVVKDGVSVVLRELQFMASP